MLQAIHIQNTQPRYSASRMEKRPATNVRFGSSYAHPKAADAEQAKPLKRLCYGMIEWYQNNRFIHDKLYKWINLKCPYGERGMPSCSQFAKEAIEKHGILKGDWMAFWRIINCNPLTIYKLNHDKPVRYRYA